MCIYYGHMCVFLQHMKFLWSKLWPGGLSTDDTIDDDNKDSDNDDDNKSSNNDDHTWWTIHDCIVSLAFMQN